MLYDVMVNIDFRILLENDLRMIMTNLDIPVIRVGPYYLSIICYHP